IGATTNVTVDAFDVGAFGWNEVDTPAGSPSVLSATGPVKLLRLILTGTAALSPCGTLTTLSASSWMRSCVTTIESGTVWSCIPAALPVTCTAYVPGATLAATEMVAVTFAPGTGFGAKSTVIPCGAVYDS